MANDPNHPDPNGPKPAGVSDGAWYGYTTVDSTKPLSQWNSWVAEGKYDPTATGYARFKSSKVDANGNPISGLGEHPDACPDGTTAYQQNQCLPVSDPRIQGAWNLDPRTQPGWQGGTGAPASGQAQAQQAPLYQPWDASGNYVNPPGTPAAGTAPTDSKPQDLQSMLQDMFAQRSGTLFGKGGPTSGAMSIDGSGNALPTGTARTAKSLGGGGLLWSDNGGDLSDWGQQKPAPTPPPVQAPIQQMQPSPANTGSQLTNALTQAAPSPSTPPGYYPGPAAGVTDLTSALNYTKKQTGASTLKTNPLNNSNFPTRNTQ